MGFGLKCCILNGQVIYIEKSKLNIADMWLIPLDRVTFNEVLRVSRYGIPARKRKSDRAWLYSQHMTIKVGVNPSLKREMWLLMDLITKKTCSKMYKSIHFWNQKNQMNRMVATDFCKIMRFSRNSSVTMVTIEFFLDSITKIWFY